jgi:hypothetical protein
LVFFMGAELAYDTIRLIKKNQHLFNRNFDGYKNPSACPRRKNYGQSGQYA